MLFWREAGKREQIAFLLQKIRGRYLSHGSRYSICWSLFDNIEWIPSHPSITFAMEITTNNRLPFVGMKIEMKGNQLATRVHRKTTKKGIKITLAIIVGTRTVHVHRRKWSPTANDLQIRNDSQIRPQIIPNNKWSRALSKTWQNIFSPFIVLRCCNKIKSVARVVKPWGSETLLYPNISS